MSRISLPRALTACLVAAAALQAAAPGARADEAAGIAIARAFAELGMTEERALCYGGTIGAALDGDLAAEAVRIVEDAGDADDVKRSVILSDPAIVGAFSRADVACPEGTGG